jgi:hypothetical protein
LEALKKENPESFDSDYLVKPAKFGDLEFKESIVKKCYVKKDILKTVENDYTSDVLKVWEEYEEGGFYGIGADTSEGKGRDSNTVVIIRFDVSPFRVVATYKSSTIDPDDFGNLIADFHNLYPNSIMGPEINNTGFAVLSTLKRAVDTDYIYRMDKTLDDGDEKIGNMGWRTMSSSKLLAISTAKKKLKEGAIEIYDIDIIDELVSYTKQDKVSSNGGTRHFDLFMAFIIALMLEGEEVSTF